MRNYIKLNGFRIFSVSYVYVDHQDHLAESLFRQAKISVRYGREYVHESSPYCIVFCKVRKADAAKFEKSIEKLKDKMLLCGHTDYAEVCGEIMDML